MDVNSAAARIQLAWRRWRGRESRGGGCGTSAGSDQEEEAAQATSGYMSASSTSASTSDSTGNSKSANTGAASCAPALPPRRSWTALPLNLHRFGDSSGDSSPIELGAFSALSVGASRTDLTWTDPPCVCRPCNEGTMELCYRNDAASEVDELAESSDSEDIISLRDCDSAAAGGSEGNGEWQRFCRPAMQKDSLGSRSQQISGKSASRSLTRRPLEPELLESLGIDCNHEILSVHSRLRGEAQLALAQAKPMAHMQRKVDSGCLACDDTDSDEARGCSWPGPLELSDLDTLGPATLRMLRACLTSRIDVCNSELVRRLVERDDLHMEQDSLLVEIEDLTRRAQEAAKRLRASESPPDRQTLMTHSSKLKL